MAPPSFYMCQACSAQPGDESFLPFSLRLRRGAEMSFGKLNAPHLVDKVAEGRKYINGEEIRVAG